jgi:hypothetical protein
MTQSVTTHGGGSGRKRLGLVLVAMLLALVGLGIWATARYWDDAGRDPFLVGATRNSSGTVSLLFGQCAAGRLTHLVVAVDSEAGIESIDQRLWALDAPEGGVSLAPESVIELELGAVPSGMAETTPLAVGIPTNKTLQVAIDTTTQSYGYFFEPDELAEHEISIQGRRVSRSRFASLVAGRCD